MKQKLFEAIDAQRARMTLSSDAIFDFAEIGFKEYRSSALLTAWLEDAGFTVEKGIAGLETAFRAEYSSGEGGPTIGLLCEYDALEKMGHACGHHLQGPCIIAAASALKDCVKEIPYRLVIYGTPAEETYSGKIPMAAAGYFGELDAALMMHANPTTCVDVKSMACANYDVTFHGRGGHAALQPDKTRSALDAIMLMNMGIEFMREHVLEDTRMHYTILDAGGPANATPKKATARVVLRSYNSAYLATLVDRFMDIVKGAGLMTQTTPEVQCLKVMKAKIPVISLNDVLMRNAELVGAPRLRGPREKTGSTDFGEVMNMLPGSCIRIAFVPEGTVSHSPEYYDAGKTQEAYDAEVNAAKILAGSVYDLLEQPQLLEEIKAEFARNKEKLAAQA